MGPSLLPNFKEPHHHQRSERVCEKKKGGRTVAVAALGAGIFSLLS